MCLGELEGTVNVVKATSAAHHYWAGAGDRIRTGDTLLGRYLSLSAVLHS